jgi:hypothetical protein
MADLGVHGAEANVYGAVDLHCRLLPRDRTIALILSFTAL